MGVAGVPVVVGVLTVAQVEYFNKRRVALERLKELQEQGGGGGAQEGQA